MKRQTLFMASIALTASLAVAAAGPAVAHPRQQQVAALPTTATVGVTIRVMPGAEIEFPHGHEFVIEVPKKLFGLRIIKPLLIPFKITGSGTAAVSIKPDEFLRVHRGPYLGQAVALGEDPHKNQKGKGHAKAKGKGHQGAAGTLGYNVIVHYPIPSWKESNLPAGGILDWFRRTFADLPGQDGVGTPPLSAEMTGKRGRYGMIYIVAQDNWTTDGKDAETGKYGGAIEAVLTVNED